MRRLTHFRNRLRSEAIYTPIDSSREEIRLAELQPGNHDDAIVVVLRVRMLSTIRPPKYEALSYAWGKDMCPNRAIVNGTVVSITDNLDAALRHLRYHDKSRMIWVDAMCINQVDVAERNAQVQMMTRIYSTALNVLIWLGPADEDDATIVCFMRGERKAKFWDIECHKTLIRICQRPWFSRVWVVQELATATSDPIVHLGTHTISWVSFSMFVRHVTAGTFHRRVLAIAPQGSSLHFQLWSAANRVISLQALRSEKNINIFTDLMTGTMEFIATDPRDKVYGILGMAGMTRSELKLEVDYTKSARDVFIETAFCLIQEEPLTAYRLLPLHSLRQGHVDDCGGVTGLPSWVMDLTIASRDMHTGYIYNRPIRWVPQLTWTWTSEIRAKQLTSLAKMDINGKLQVVGSQIGTVVATSQDLLFNNNDGNARVPGNAPIPFANLQRIYNELIQPRNISISKLLRTFQSSTDLYLETINEDRDALTQIVTGSTGDSNDALQRQITSTAGDLILYVTGEGDVGITYHPDPVRGIVAGDVVVGLFDVCLPFVLRRLESGEYSMVNVAYVEGHRCKHPGLNDLPDGITGEDIWSSLGQYGLQEYTII